MKRYTKKEEQIILSLPAKEAAKKLKVTLGAIYQKRKALSSKKVIRPNLSATQNQNRIIIIKGNSVRELTEEKLLIADEKVLKFTDNKYELLLIKK